MWVDIILFIVKFFKTLILLNSHLIFLMRNVLLFIKKSLLNWVIRLNEHLPQTILSHLFILFFSLNDKVLTAVLLYLYIYSFNFVSDQIKWN